jgi:hypothetical protein
MRPGGDFRRLNNRRADWQYALLVHWQAMRTLMLLAIGLPVVAAPLLRLHPENPHYFLFRGRPTVLVTSGEHYGAVLNFDFDFKAYLAELQRHGLNHTRVFAGAYREVPGNFGIGNNTLAPKDERFLGPWVRRGNNFDLTRWDPAYFARLKEFMKEASRRGVVVELNLFCPFYEESMWRVSPFNTVPRQEAFTLKHAAITEAQVALVRKIVGELRDFDNLFYEIMNEPYAGAVTPQWQRTISRAIADAEAGFAEKHLISQNISNGSKKIDDPDPLVSIFNFHYSRPPDAVAMNYGLNKAIGMNETGFDGRADATYRIQGWDFLMAGGALYNNLDYSFAVGHERGDLRYDEKTPGGGSTELRRQLGVLREFFGRIEFVRMAPAVGIVGGLPEGASGRALAQSGKTYAVYVHHGRFVKGGKPQYVVDGASRPAKLTLELPKGRYSVEWLDPKSGKWSGRRTVTHAGGACALEGPAYTEDVALLVRAN